MLDNLAFGMNMIDEEGSKPGSVGSAGAVPRETRSKMKERATGDMGSGNEADEAADGLSNRSIDSNGFDKKAKPHPLDLPGPSLLTQMAPLHSGATISSSNTGPLSTSIAPSASAAATSDMLLFIFIISINSNPSMSFRDETSNSSVLERNGRIIVKIADLGNGVSSSHVVIKLWWFFVSHLDRTPLYGRYPDAAVPLSGGDSRCEIGNERRYMSVAYVLSPVPTSLLIGVLLTFLCSKSSTQSPEATTFSTLLPGLGTARTATTWWRSYN